MTFSRDIADLAKILGGRMRLEAVPVDMAGLLANVRAPIADQELSPIPTDRMTVGPVPATIMADEARLTQALQRTVAAILEHLPPDSFRCQAGARAVEDGVHLGFEITVDSGQAPESLALTLEAAESRDPTLPRQFGRAGLWLALVDALARLMGGRVLGRAGHRLVGVELPIFPIEPEGETCSLAFRVLVVDDGRVNQIVARRILEQIGCEVVVASDGTEACDLHSRQGFDLILMDWEMPGMNGDEASRRIRRTDAMRQVPILGITAKGSRSSWTDCVEVGMNDLLPKPLRPDDLIRAVNYWRASAARLV